MPLFQKEVIIRIRHRVFPWNDAVLKSDLALSTTLNTDQINTLVKEVRKRLADLHQPIHPYDIEKITHYTLLEMNQKANSETYLAFLVNRRNQRTVESTKVVFITCKYCGISNPTENKVCAGCGSPLDLSRTGSKVV